jgi:outer membrane protein insertion porin family
MGERMNNMQRVDCRLSILLITILFFTGCSTTQFLKEGETFYEGAEIEFNTPGRRVARKRVIEREMMEYISPKPNAKFLGLRSSVWLYYKTDHSKKKGLKNTIGKKWGRPPVLLNDATPDRTAKLLEGYLYNEGYFKSIVTTEIKTHKKKSKVIYKVMLQRPFRLKSIDYPHVKDSVYAGIIRTLKERSLLRTKQRYQLERLQAEQKRIENELKDIGFYYFDDRYLLFVADSTVGKRQIDLALELEPDMPKRAKRIYQINEVTILPEYSLSTDSADTQADTIRVNKYNYVERSHYFRPEIITSVINIEKGKVYSKEEQELTTNHLMGLGVFKFVNVKYKEAYRDSNLLDATIYLTPLKRKSIRMEAQGVSKSNNFVGPGLSFVYTDRNLLKGAELFQVKLNSAYEVQFSRQNQNPLNSFELGVESSLIVPRLITPVRINFNSRRYLPKTRFKTGFNLQNRLGYFRLSSFNAGYGYNWRETVSKTHELFPIDVTYVKTDKTSLQFEELLRRNSVLAKSFEDQFIFGSRYSYTFNTQLREEQPEKYGKRKVQENHFYVGFNLDVAGNLLNAVRKQFNESTDEAFELFGNPYSQFVRSEIDLRYYWQPNANNKIASRIILGVGHAYGNSTTLPYIKQFAIGGSNSIRAFTARSIGPGTYNVRTDPNYQSTTLFVDQRADIKIEGNLEYRFPVYRSFKGALFIDVGNIWLRKEDTSRPGGGFDFDTFLKQLAVGTGFGLRYDFSFFVLRLDTAFPIRRPDLGWVIDNIEFQSAAWRKSNLIFNIAIGYPF